MKIARPLLLLVLACSPLAHAGDLVLAIGKHAISAEVADTPAAREHGLMQRTRLCADCGMIFVFPTAARYGFWMKNTPLPIAIAFIGGDGRIVNIVEMQPYSLDIHYAQADSQYALEMNSGWFAAHGVNTGDTVEGLRPGIAPKSGEPNRPLPNTQK
jgi:uncharacterized membrane protein (UPF0127 family)